MAGVQRDPKYGSRDAKYSLVSNIGYLKVHILHFSFIRLSLDRISILTNLT